MTRSDILQKLTAAEPQLRAKGVCALYLFGSVARDEARPDSDVDLFFDYQDPDFDLFDLMDVKSQIEQILQRRADVMTSGSLHPVLKPDILASVCRVF